QGGAFGALDLLELVDLVALAVVDAADAFGEEGLEPGVRAAHGVLLTIHRDCGRIAAALLFTIRTFPGIPRGGSGRPFVLANTENETGESCRVGQVEPECPWKGDPNSGL